MRDYLLDMMEKDNITADDYTFSIIPVDLVTETSGDNYYGTSTSVTAINPYVTQPVMVNLDLKAAKVRLVYTKQSLL